MFEDQNFDNDSLDVPEKNKNYVKIIVIISVIAVLAVVGALFFFLYSKGDENENSGEVSDVSNAGVSSEEVVSSEMSTDESVVTSEETSDESFENSEASFEESSLSDESSESSEESSEEVSAEPDHGWVINNMGYTYLYQGAGFNQFNGTKTLAQKYADALNKFTTTASFPVYSIIVPTSVEFVEIPYDVKQSDDFYNSSQKSYISNAAASITAKSLDVYTLISNKVKEEYLYFKTDKNWTADAAYLAYVAFCEATGNITASKTAYEMGSYTGYLGNFYNATNSEKLKANADTVNYYKINNEFPCTVTMYRGGLAYKDRALIYTELSNPTSYAYYAFLGDRGETFTITSQNSATEKTLLVVGDSSAFAFVPYLVANYRNIYFVNAESFKGKISEYIADKNIDESVVLSYATSSVTTSYVKSLDGMFS